jgi:D-3-phosphoglycerate dehydrogenase
MPKVLIADKMSPAAEQIFKDRGVEVDVITGLERDELIKIIDQYDGLAVRSSTKATPPVLEAATNMKVIGRAGIGVDNIDLPTATANGIVVMNTPFGNSITTAEHAIAMMFALARQIPEANASTHAGKWEKSRFMGVELTGKTLGVIGCGNIGSIAASRALGLKMKVVAFDPFLTPDRALEMGVEKAELNELLARADFITLHTPLTDKTRNILNADALAKCKKGVRIINWKAAKWLVPPWMCSKKNPPKPMLCSTWKTSSARRIWAPAQQRRKKTSPCKWPNKWPTF